MKRLNIPTSDEAEASGIKVSHDLEKAIYKFERASTALDKNMRVLIENYPQFVILANKLPRLNGQHPYLRIRKVAYLYKNIS